MLSRMVVPERSAWAAVWAVLQSRANREVGRLGLRLSRPLMLHGECRRQPPGRLEPTIRGSCEYQEICGGCGCGCKRHLGRGIVCSGGRRSTWCVQYCTRRLFWRFIERNAYELARSHCGIQSRPRQASAGRGFPCRFRSVPASVARFVAGRGCRAGKGFVLQAAWGWPITTPSFPLLDFSEREARRPYVWPPGESVRTRCRREDSRPAPSS